MNSFLYHYRAIFKSNYDGDTITVDIDLGMGIWVRNQKLRLYGINTPEIRGNDPAGKVQAIKARDFVRRRIPEGSEIVIETHKDRSGKFGRLLATIFLKSVGNGVPPSGDGSYEKRRPPSGDGSYRSLNDLLVESGLAVRAEY